MRALAIGAPVAPVAPAAVPSTIALMEANPAVGGRQRYRGLPRLAAGVIRRERLLSMLRADVPLTVVLGAVSSGKTVLVTQWLREADLDGDVVWVSRDLTIGARVAFWQSVLDVLLRAGLIDARQRGVTLDEFADDERGRTAVRSLFEQLPQPLTLVLDNFGPPGAYWDRVADDLLHLLRRVPGLRVIAIGRSRTRLDSTEAGLEVDRITLTEDDLRVTATELRALAAAVGVEGLAPEEIDALGEASDWCLYPARYALETARRTGVAATPDLVRGLDRRLIEHLAGAGLLDFAAPVALAPYITVAFARELTGAPDAAERLERLEQVSLGALVAAEDGGEVFRFTGRARAALVAHLDRTDPARAREARSALARWLRGRREDALAAELAVKAEDLALLEPILVGAWGTVSREKGAMLVPLLLSIDPARILKHPVLSLYLALVLNARSVDQAAAAPYFRAAIEGARGRGRGATVRERYMFAVGETIAARLTGDSRGAHAAAKRAVGLEELLSHEDRSSFGEILPVMVSQCGHSAFYAGDVAFARRAFLRAIALGVREVHATTTNGWYGWLALLDVLEGRMRAAREHLDRIDDDGWSEAAAQGYAGAGRIIATAYLALDAGEIADALDQLDRLAPHFATIEHWAIIATVRALATALGGAPAEAAVELRRLLEARDARIGSAGRAAPEVAGADGVLETLELLRGGGHVEERSGGRPSGRNASVGLAIRAVRAALAGRDEAAMRLLGRAEAVRTSPLQDLLVAIAGVVIARGGGGDLGPFSVRIAMVVSQESLHWPLALLSEGDRSELLAALESSPLAGDLTAAFAAVPPLRRAATQPVILTEREREMLVALVTGETRAEIAARRFVSLNTVRTHLKSLYRKLGVSDREAAILRGIELGLLASSAVVDQPAR